MLALGFETTAHSVGTLHSAFRLFFFTLLALCYLVKEADFSFICCLALAFKLTNAALIIGCILLYFSHTALPPVPSRLCRLLSVYNGLSQCAAVELAFCLCLQQHSADPLIEGLCEERPEAAEGLQSCGLKQPASDKRRGPPGERSFEEKHREARRKGKHEIRPQCSSISCRQRQISAAQLYSYAFEHLQT